MAGPRQDSSLQSPAPLECAGEYTGECTGECFKRKGHFGLRRCQGLCRQDAGLILPPPESRRGKSKSGNQKCKALGSPATCAKFKQLKWGADVQKKRAKDNETQHARNLNRGSGIRARPSGT